MRDWRMNSSCVLLSRVSLAGRLASSKCSGRSACARRVEFVLQRVVLCGGLRELYIDYRSYAVVPKRKYETKAKWKIETKIVEYKVEQNIDFKREHVVLFNQLLILTFQVSNFALCADTPSCQIYQRI